MSYEKVEISKNSISDLIIQVVRIYHPAIRKEMTWLKQSFARLIMEDGPNQSDWISAYKLFFRFSSNMDDHMFSEETVLFPRLEALEKNYLGQAEAVGPLPAINPEEEHHVIFQFWASVKALVEKCHPPELDRGLVGNIHSEIEKLQKAIDDHEEFEMTKIYRIALEKGFVSKW